ncbi:MAG: hypothetical protein JST64_10745, partial [Actinobacteria bacterium]|nr:hypothetical protein [Actinomycetota bacterium]
DFGIADLDEMDAGTITVASISPPHAPPERFTDEAVDERAGDIYSLGSTIYFTLAGSPPFGTMSAGGSLGLARRITTDPVPEIQGLAPQANAVIARSMAKRPEDRFPDVMSFAQAFDAAAGNAWEAPPQPPPLPAWMADHITESGWQAIADEARAGPEPADVLAAPASPTPPDPSPWMPSAPPMGAEPAVEDDPTVLKSSVAARSAPGHGSGRRPRRLVALVLATALVGLVVGFVAVRVASSGSAPIELVVRDATSGNPLPKTTAISVNGQSWNPTFHRREARRTFDSAVADDRGTLVSVDVPERVTVRVPPSGASGGGTQVVSIVIGDDSVEVGSTSRARNNPLAEAQRVRTALEPLGSYSEQVWTLNQALFPNGQMVPYDVIIPAINAQILPVVDRALGLFDNLHSSDAGVQAGIDAYRRCWVLRRAFFVEEANPGRDRVPAEPAATYEQRRLDADQKVDQQAWKQQDDACKDPTIVRLRGH